MDASLLIAVDSDESPDRIRQNLLNRLHWNVFGSLDEVTVQDSITLTLLSNHHIKSKIITDSPLFKITIQISICVEKYSMDETEEEDRYQTLEPLVIEKRGTSPISISDFVNHVHPFLNANKDNIFKCEDELYIQPAKLEDGTTFFGVDPDEFNWGEGDENSHFSRSWNIPAGSRFFFDEARFKEVDTDESEIYVVLFVEGNMGISSDEFWAQRAEGMIIGY